jgi:predicted aspartyl protease
MISHGLLTLAAAIAAPMPPPTQTPMLPSATIDESLEVTGEDIAARQVKSRVTVPVRVNGQGPFRFVVDSGADRSVIGLVLARRLALPPGDGVTLHGMAGAQRVETVLIDMLAVGGNAIAGVVAPALAEEYLGAQGLLGIDALAGQKVVLDFERRLITVEKANVRVEAAAADEIVVTARRRFGQLILTQAAVDRARIFAVIDSGAEVTVGNSALRRKVLTGRRPPVPQRIDLLSVTGQILTADLIVLPRLRIGGILLQDVPVAFVDAPPFALFGLKDDPALLLGTDLLQSFRKVSMDFRNRRVRFQLRY